MHITYVTRSGKTIIFVLNGNRHVRFQAKGENADADVRDVMNCVNTLSSVMAGAQAVLDVVADEARAKDDAGIEMEVVPVVDPA